MALKLIFKAASFLMKKDEPNEKSLKSATRKVAKKVAGRFLKKAFMDTLQGKKTLTTKAADAIKKLNK